MSKKNTTDLNQFLNLVIRHCSVGGLTEVELYHVGSGIPSNIIQESMPFFSNLRKLVVFNDMWYHEFLASVSTTATNLTHLTLDNKFDIKLASTGMEHLKELRLRSSSIDEKELLTFLRNKSKLELFSCTAKNGIDSVIDTLAAHCPKLRVFSDFHLDNPYAYGRVISDRLQSRYSAVRYFDTVQELGLTTYTKCGSDLYYPLIQITKKNKLESLKIVMNHADAIALEEQERKQYNHQSFADFTSLKEVELLLTVEFQEYEFDVPFIAFIVKETNVKKFCVKCDRSIVNIYKIIDAVPHLSQLDVSQVPMIRLPVEMRRIVVSIRKRRANLISMGEIEPAPSI